MKFRLTIAGFLGVSLLSQASSAHSQDMPRAPEFSVQACCQLCSAASIPRAYEVHGVENYKMLRQGDDGWLFRNADLQQNLRISKDGVQQLARFSRLLAQRGTTLILALRPTRALVHPERLPAHTAASYDHHFAQFNYRASLQALRDHGVAVAPLDELGKASGQQELYFRRDPHWTPAGARRAAELVARTVRQQTGMTQLPSQEFTTLPDGLVRKQGALQKAAEALCGTGYAAQYVPGFRTVSADAGKELPQPGIVLVGTSFSAPRYNFGGFLAEQLGSPVRNEAGSGRGLKSGMHGYLRTSYARQAPPKFLIWELAATHDLSDSSFYRELLPLLNTHCEQTAQLRTRTPLKSGRNEILFNGDGQVLPLRSEDYQIELLFSDPSIREFEAVIWYTSGSQEKNSFNYSRRIDTAGHYALNLREDGDWAQKTFLSADLMLPRAPAPGSSVRARLCRRSL